MKGYIYSLSDENGVFYIGCSTQPELRAKAHKNSSRYFDEKLNRFIEYDSFEFKMEIVDEINFKFRQELIELEDYWINQFKQWGFKLKNTLFRKNLNHHKTPSDILNLLKKSSPHINPYRTIESDGFVNALYKIIRLQQDIISKNKY